MKHLTQYLAITALLCLAATHAHAQHVDILAYDNGGEIGTGCIDVDTGQPQTDVRLFTETFNIVQSTLFGTTAPGYFSNTNYPLLPSSDLGFNAMAMTHPDTQQAYNLMYWDGLGEVNFGTPESGTTLQFRLSSSTNISVDGSASDVAGFVLDGTSPTGVLHKHISYSARGPGGTQPADGLYLASIRLIMPGLADSDTVYLLFNADYQRDALDNIVYLGDAPQVDPVSGDLAVAWIEQYLIESRLEGDLDGDGFVGITDLNTVLGNWNTTVFSGDLLAGDPSGDGFVGIEDLNVILGNWNAGTPPSDASSLIPEPGTLVMLGASGVMMLVRRRKDMY